MLFWEIWPQYFHFHHKIHDAVIFSAHWLTLHLNVSLKTTPTLSPPKTWADECLKCISRRKKKHRKEIILPPIIADYSRNDRSLILSKSSRSVLQSVLQLLFRSSTCRTSECIALSLNTLPVCIAVNHSYSFNTFSMETCFSSTLLLMIADWWPAQIDLPAAHFRAGCLVMSFVRSTTLWAQLHHTNFGAKILE